MTEIVEFETLYFKQMSFLDSLLELSTNTSCFSFKGSVVCLRTDLVAIEIKGKSGNLINFPKWS